ncbi:MAG TPA: NAD(P)-binding domain-containing protein [Clostridia bacterium]|nr:NAD(P)-binding domain-containing protein [Clostridia bacterium]
MKKIGIVGFGNLGRAFAKALVEHRIYERGDILVCSKSEATLALAREQFGIGATLDVNEVFRSCEYVFLAVKKNVFLEFAPKIERTSLVGKTVVSFMAGFPAGEIREALGGGAVIARAMPTLAIVDARGIIAYTKECDRAVRDAFHRLGFAFEVAEEDIEKTTVYAACGLGFAAYLIDAYIRAGITLGFDEHTSKRIAEMNFASAIRRSDYPATMSEVATKGGLTEYGFRRMTGDGVDAGIEAAVLATYRKSRGEPVED